STRARRRRIRLCWSTHFARYSTLRPRLQHEVPGHLCGLRCDHVDVWTNGHGSSLRTARDQCSYDCADLFPRPQSGELNNGTCSGDELRGALRKSIGAGIRRPRNTFRAAPGSWRDAASIQLERSANVWTVVRERVALRDWVVNEATCSFFCFIWNDLPYLSRSSSPGPSENNSRARPDFQCRCNSSGRCYLPPSLASRGVR